MKIDINEKIIAETDRCSKSFECLKNDKHIHCEVDNCINEKVHFIKCVDKQDCNYRMSFGYSFMCTCPIRKEIFNKLKK